MSRSRATFPVSHVSAGTSEELTPKESLDECGSGCPSNAERVTSPLSGQEVPKALPSTSRRQSAKRVIRLDGNHHLVDNLAHARRQPRFTLGLLLFVPGMDPSAEDDSTVLNLYLDVLRVGLGSS